MAARKKKTPDVVTPAPPAAVRTRKRFYMQKMPDGVGERAVRVINTRRGARDQAMADYFGSGSELPLQSNQRSIESLLGELLSELDLQEDALAPDLLAAAWAEAVGDALASVSSLQSVGKGKACISVTHPMVRYEITRLKPQIIRALNRTLGAGSVRALILS